jgi:hypothetical protein
MLRLMSEAANTVQVTILTGFLGSGKTMALAATPPAFDIWL